jgi:hypothetical protein
VRDEETATEELLANARPLTSVELLDVAIWREIKSEDAQPAYAFLEALSGILGRWLLMRSETPEIDLMTVLCRARGYIQRGGAEPIRKREWTR